MNHDILIVGGYGSVGSHLAVQLGTSYPGRVLVGGRHPEQAQSASRQVDVDDRASVDAALEGVRIVIACVRQREPHLLNAAIERGIAYTSIAPPWMEWSSIDALRPTARRTGARIILAAGLEPGISSILARAAVDRLGGADSIETALLLSVGDAYGADSMGFLLDELVQSYSVVINGQSVPTRAFERFIQVRFPEDSRTRRAYRMPFRDQLYYPHTLEARTAVAHLALSPAWLGDLAALLTRFGARSLMGHARGRSTLHEFIAWLRAHSSSRRFSLVVDVSRGSRRIRSSLTGEGQAEATAAGVGAVAEALVSGEVREPGVWLAEQVLNPAQFLERLQRRGLTPVSSELPAE